MSRKAMHYSSARDLEIKFAHLQEIYSHVELGEIGLETFVYYFI